MKAATRQTLVASLLVTLLIVGGLFLASVAHGAPPSASDAVTLSPDQPSNQLVVPAPAAEPSQGGGAPSVEETPPAAEETGAVPAQEATPGEDVTGSAPPTSSVGTTETTHAAEPTPTLPGSESELPFTGGQPLGFWILGGVLGLAGTTALFMSARQQRRTTKGTPGRAGRLWIGYSAGTMLLVAGLSVAAYPSVTDLRYLWAQQSIAMASEGQAMPGQAVARLVIPRIALDAYVLEGTDSAVLDQAPGHFPGTPLPGQNGNAAIAGHRTMYGHPFNRLDELKPGDEIRAFTTNGGCVYRVISVAPVSPTDVAVAGPQGDDRLTLTTCHPIGSARQRLVVAAALVR